MSGPSRRLLRWATIYEEPEIFQEIDEWEFPVVYSRQGDFEFPLVKTEIPDNHPVFKIRLHGGRTHVWAYLRSGDPKHGLCFYYGTGTGDKLGEEPYPRMSLHRKENPCTHYTGMSNQQTADLILGFANKLGTTNVSRKLFKWLRSEPYREYKGPDLPLERTLGGAFVHSPSYHCIDNYTSRFVGFKNPTATYGHYGPFMVYLALIDGYWEFCAFTTNAKKGRNFFITGENQIMRFLRNEEDCEDLVKRAMKHIDSINDQCIVADK